MIPTRPRRHRTLGLALVLALALCAATQAQIATYTVPRASAAPKLDGRLGDACWETACVVDSFNLLGGQAAGKEAQVKTVAYLTHDADALYVAYRCTEPLADKLIITTQEHDGPTWKDDGVELFFNPSGDRKRYCQIAINAAGVIMDNYGELPARTLDKSYETGAPAKTHVGKGEWTLEVRIPFSGLPIEDLDCPWTFHLARHRAVGNELITSLRSPVTGFHEIDRFDVLRGISLRHRRVAVQAMSIGDLLAGTNVARCTLKNVSAAPASVRVAAGVVGATEPHYVQRDVALAPGAEAPVEVRWGLHEELSGRDAVLAVVLAGQTLRRVSKRIESVPPIFAALPLRAHYCDPNESVRLELPIQLAEGSRGECRLTWAASDAPGETVGHGLTVVRGSSAVVRLYWPRWRPGWYTLSLALLRDGKAIATSTEQIRLLPSPWSGF